jgi:hypothetical protein
VRGFIFRIHPQIPLGRSNRGECGGRGIGEERKVYKVLVGKSMEKSQIGSPRHRWQQNAY